VVFVAQLLDARQQQVELGLRFVVASSIDQIDRSARAVSQRAAFTEARLYVLSARHRSVDSRPHTRERRRAQVIRKRERLFAVVQQDALDEVFARD
jgi:hypothetical protein